MVRTKTSTNTKALPPPPPKDQVDMDYEELIKQLEEENHQLRQESKYWEEQARKFMARLTEVIYWYEGDVENVFGEEKVTKRKTVGHRNVSTKRRKTRKGRRGRGRRRGGRRRRRRGRRGRDDTWREWWEESGEDWKKWWDMGVKQLEW